MAKKKIGKHLQFYLHSIQSGTIKDFGLCNSIKSGLLDLFIPTKEDEDVLRREGVSVLFWGSGLPSGHKYDHERWYSFSPLRQTIVLLMAAINNEL
jgi:hypothetical protein